jgi:hypothetical protein
MAAQSKFNEAFESRRSFAAGLMTAFETRILFEFKENSEREAQRTGVREYRSLLFDAEIG